MQLWQTFSQWLTLVFEGKKQKSTIAALDGVRAIACLIVVEYHLSLITTNDIPLWKPSQFSVFLNALTFAGDTGVTLFFILSGFLLFLPYAKALLFHAPWPSLRQFYLRRALRILPAYYVTLFLMMLIYHPEYLHRDHLKQILIFLTLFIDSSSSTFKQINGPFWTLAVEWQFYLLLPLLAYGIRMIVRRGRLAWRLSSLALCLALLAAWGLITRYIGLYITDHPGTTFHLPPIIIKIFLFFTYGIPTSGLHGKFLEDFAVGMLLSSAYLLIRAPSTRKNISTLVEKLSPWIFLAGLLWLYAMSLWKYDQRIPHILPGFDHWLPYYPPMGEFGYAIGYGLCVFAILLGPALLKQIFEWRPLRRIGLLSFGLYMWHLLLLESFSQLFIQGRYLAGWPHGLLYSLYWVWLFIFILPCVFLLFICIEKPGMQLAERFRGKGSTRSVTEADKIAHDTGQLPQHVTDTEVPPSQNNHQLTTNDTGTGDDYQPALRSITQPREPVEE
jgi:peptidoglycan/LPS O-acetylase OafA/YrhL